MSEYIIGIEGALHADYIELAPKISGEIIRCRDCKHVGHIPDFQSDRRFKPCDYWWCEAEWCEGLEGDNPTVEPDGFCAWGERRES